MCTATSSESGRETRAEHRARLARSVMWAAHLHHAFRALQHRHSGRSDERMDLDRRFPPRLQARLSAYLSGEAIVLPKVVESFGGFEATDETYRSPLWAALDPNTTALMRAELAERIERRVSLDALLRSQDAGQLPVAASEHHLDRVALLVFAIRMAKRNDSARAFQLGRLLVRETVFLLLRPEFRLSVSVLWNALRADPLKDLAFEGYAFAKSDCCFDLFVNLLQSKLDELHEQSWRSVTAEPLAQGTVMDLTCKYVRLFTTPGPEALDDLIGGLRKAELFLGRFTQAFAQELEQYPLFVPVTRKRTSKRDLCVFRTI